MQWPFLLLRFRHLDGPGTELSQMEKVLGQSLTLKICGRGEHYSST